MITGKVIGGDALLNKFKNMGDEAPKIFKEVVDDTAEFMKRQAVNNISQNVKTGTGHLKQSMYTDLTGSDFAIVGNRAEYAGYVEFGTGKKVSVPPEFSDIAAKVRSRPTKSFKEGLEAIKDWCKRLGIDVKAAYPIFMSILGYTKNKGSKGWSKNGVDGVRPRPFFYPAYLSGKRYFGKEAAKALKELTKVK